MSIDRQKAHKVFNEYDSIKNRIIELQDIVRNPDFVTHEFIEGMLSDSEVKTQKIKDELDRLHSDIVVLLEESRGKKEP